MNSPLGAVAPPRVPVTATSARRGHRPPQEPLPQGGRVYDVKAIAGKLKAR